MSNPIPINPRRGEVWDVILESNAGSEPLQSQPTVIISSDGLNNRAKRLVVPLTEWKDYYSDLISIVSIKPTGHNGLAIVSAADAMQIRGVNVNHFISRRGRLSANDIEEISAAIAAIIEHK